MHMDLPDQLPSEPEEWLFEVIVRFRRDLEVLEVFLAVESNRTSLHFPFLIDKVLRRQIKVKIATITNLDINLVTTEDNGDVLANTLKVPMPVGDVLVRDTGGDIKHDDATLPLNIIPITKSTKLFLARCIPDIEDQVAKICRK
jgi:hypothetical protein